MNYGISLYDKIKTWIFWNILKVFKHFGFWECVLVPRNPDDDGGGGGSDPDDPSSAESSDNSKSSKVSSLRRKHLTRPKIRESDDIKFPKLPAIPAYRAWKNLVYQSVNAASGRPDDKAMRWVMQSEDQSLSDDFFHTVPKDFRTLSRKLHLEIYKNKL